MFHLNKFENDSEFFDRGTALLIVLLDRHDAIVPQFNILEANKVKRLVVLNKTHQPFSFMSPPNSIALNERLNLNLNQYFL